MDGVDVRDLRIADQEREIAELTALVLRLEERARRAEERVVELEARLKRNSSNSSQPPSSDSPSHQGRKKRAHRRSGRRPGGQPGHQGHRRIVFPPEAVTASQDIKPRVCGHCGFDGLEGEDPRPLLHQILELPPLSPLIDEKRLHELLCPRCAHKTRAELPAGVPKDTMGPRLTAALAFLTSLRLGKRVVSLLMEHLFKVPVSPASVCKAEQKTSAAVAKPVDEVHDHLAGENVNADETGWFEKHRRRWLWVAATATCTFFMVQGSRNAAAAMTLLGHAFAGLLTTDRHGAYNIVELLRRQVCWAHLVRDFQALVDSGNRPCREIGEALLAQTVRLFHLWHAFKQGELTRPQLQEAMQPVMAAVVGTLHVGSRAHTKKLARFCAGLLKLEPALWTFLREEGVEPTNNHAERTIRHAVIWRKISHGTQTPAGSLFVGRILTVVTTLRQQGRNVLDWLVDALTAQLHGTGPPSLLPQTASP